MFKTIDVVSSNRVEFIDITKKVNDMIAESGINEGTCYLFVPHTTAGLTINECADPSVIFDIINKTNKLIGFEDNYYHSEGNSDAHIKSSIFGVSLTLVISNSRLFLGTWQGVYFCEFDGPRNRKLTVRLLEQ